MKLTWIIPVGAISALAVLAFRPAPPSVKANDNRVPAGRLAGDSLVVAFDVEYARWFPESEQGASVEVAAFREPGKAPQIPGPLIRVRTGTTIIATIRNRLPDSSITVFGLGTKPGFQGRGIRLERGEERTIRFTAGQPGTYLYWGEVGHRVVKPGPFQDFEREQLAGAFVVDPAEGSPLDRVLVINIWGEGVD
jgi:manganese oxidase